MNENTKDKKTIIIETLKKKGPSLPVHISRSTGLDMIFASAYLSEMASNKTVKISNMKVGGSPIYYLPDQKKELEKYSQHLPNKEKEAFDLLKENGSLEDSKQEPAIRVALRNLKDFAFPFKKNGELFWRFYNISEKTTPKKEKEVKEDKGEKQGEKDLDKNEKKSNKSEGGKEKKDRKKNKTEFSDRISNILNKENIEILKEKDIKKKQYIAVVGIKSVIGKIKFLLMAKDKKRVSDTDLMVAVQKAQALKMPALFMTPGKLTKKAQAYLEQYSSMLKFKEIE
jgi:hypothetical protein